MHAWVQTRMTSWSLRIANPSAPDGPLPITSRQYQTSSPSRSSSRTSARSSSTSFLYAALRAARLDPNIREKYSSGSSLVRSQERSKSLCLLIMGELNRRMYQFTCTRRPRATTLLSGSTADDGWRKKAPHGWPGPRYALCGKKPFTDRPQPDGSCHSSLHLQRLIRRLARLIVPVCPPA